MPRVHHVKKARKDNPAVKKGEPYYWWKFRYGGKRYSATPPRASQLTQSEHYGLVYSTQENIEDADTDSKEDVISALEEAYDEIESHHSELEEKQSNLEDAWPNGCPVLDTIMARVEAMETLKEEIESAKDAVEEIDPDAMLAEKVEEKKTELDLDESAKLSEDVMAELENEVSDDVSSAIMDAVGNIGWDVGE
jgi:DNA repair exonuclease SbcCD ATPase subunit